MEWGGRGDAHLPPAIVGEGVQLGEERKDWLGVVLGDCDEHADSGRAQVARLQVDG